MDWVRTQDRLVACVKKYRYAIIIVLVGLLLMWIPGGQKNAKTEKEPEILNILPQKEDISDALENILEQIQGAGKVQVLLTELHGEEILFQSDENLNTDDTSVSSRTETVLVTGADRQQNGLIRQINPPRYQGAIVVCQGGDNASVRLAVVEAVSSVTGLGADRISVLKMK